MSQPMSDKHYKLDLVITLKRKYSSPLMVDRFYRDFKTIEELEIYLDSSYPGAKREPLITKSFGLEPLQVGYKFKFQESEDGDYREDWASVFVVVGKEAPYIFDNYDNIIQEEQEGGVKNGGRD